MTIVEVPHDHLEAETVVVETHRPLPRRLTRREQRVVVIGVLAVVAGILLTIVLLEGPVANLMYSQRQRERTAEYLDPSGAARIRRGDAVALLQVPSLGLNAAVAEGDGPSELRGGPGHRIGTPLPGEVGNVVILGRQKSFGGPFGRLDELTPGALISVQVRGSLSAVDYLVREVRRVPEHDIGVLQTSVDERLLTLVTSDGGLFSQERLVVVADYDAGLPLAPRTTDAAPGPAPAQAFAPAAAGPAAAGPADVDEIEALAPEEGFDSGVTFLGVVIVLVWAGVIASLLVSVRQLRARFPIWLTALVLTPVVGVAVVQLWFALDALGPVTR